MALRQGRNKKEIVWIEIKQVIQNYHTGKLKLAKTPAPLCSSKSILVQNRASLISIGTDRSVIELRQKNILGKADR
jgi:hypothetical protein